MPIIYILPCQQCHTTTKREKEMKTDQKDLNKKKGKNSRVPVVWLFICIRVAFFWCITELLSLTVVPVPLWKKKKKKKGNGPTDKGKNIFSSFATTSQSYHKSSYNVMVAAVFHFFRRPKEPKDLLDLDFFLMNIWAL